VLPPVGTAHTHFTPSPASLLPYGFHDGRVASILIIEPDSVAHKLLAEFVSDLGHQVMGPEDTASGAGPDLVLLEPADEGSLALAQTLRARHARLPIVCVSSEHPTEAVDELQPSAFLAKPFRGRLLEWAIDEALLATPALAAA
jgi:DNA-binding response OmpR family regulator